MEFLEVLTEGLNRVLLVRGGGREVITIYSWKNSLYQPIPNFNLTKCFIYIANPKTFPYQPQAISHNSLSLSNPHLKTEPWQILLLLFLPLNEPLLRPLLINFY